MSPKPEINERQRRLRNRNLAVFFALLGFVALVYAVTMIKMKLTGGL